MSKILAVDIGNSTISFGVFKGRRLITDFRLSTNQKGMSYYARSIRRAFRKSKVRKGCIDQIILCSVVPQKTTTIKKILIRIFKKKILNVGTHFKVPIKNRYKNQNQVGIDRLLGAYAALKLYGPGLIIVDFGTAVTFDIVSKRSEFLGGLIFPGIDLSLDALYHHSALLPRIAITNPKSLVGKDSVSAITSGIVFGMAGVCDTIIQRLKKQYRGYKVIATGGNMNFIKRYSASIKVTRRTLVLDGLALLLTR